MTWIALGPGPRLPPRSADERTRRLGRLAGVLLLVLAVHGWLIGPVRAPLGRAPAPGAPIQLVTLPTLPVPEPAPPPAPPETPAPAQAERAPEPSAVPQAPPAPTSPTPDTPVPTARPKEDRPVDWWAGPRPPETLAVEEETLQAAAAAAAASAASMPAAAPVAGSDSTEGRPPPIYLTAPPAQTFTLDYRMERGDESGTGRLRFELDANSPNSHYRAQFSGVTANDKAVVDWVSRGSFDAAGMAPQRMVERQRGIEVRAVNFQRDQQVISFSSSTRSVGLFGGAQDRVSLMLQLAAIAQAEPGGLLAGQRIRLQVANARGQVDDWIFEVIGRERIEPSGMPIDTLHLTREPTQPYDQRVELWLAPSAGHLPVGLRFTPVPGKESTAYWLSGRLPAPAAASAASGTAR